jgi:hypothetical protein
MEEEGVFGKNMRVCWKRRGFCDFARGEGGMEDGEDGETGKDAVFDA